MRQGDKKAAGRSGMGGQVLKEAFKVGWVREEIREVVKRSLQLGYVANSWRKSVGIIIRKPNKEDYRNPNSYRIINLLQVLGKVVERIVARRLEKWGPEGMGDEQYGGRGGRSCMDGVDRLYEKWEKGGKKGVLLCMNVRGGYENVGVGKCMERMRGLGVDEYLVKWGSSFLRDREVRVRVGNRVSGGGKMRGETVQGSPLSPIVFMYILGAVLEELSKDNVEGVEMMGCVDDVEFMMVGEDERSIKERVRRMEVGLERGLKKWEVDVQVMKVEGMWMWKDGVGFDRGIRWLGEEVRMKTELRVLGVWMEENGGWRSHVVNRLRIGEVRWRMMMKLLGRGGRGMCVEGLKRIWNMVVEQSVLYGMELYWNGQEEMRRVLLVWLNRGMRRILGAVRSTLVDAMLGELGKRRVEWDFDRRVKSWGKRLLRKGEGEYFAKTWKEREVGYGCYESGWGGRMFRRVKENKLEGEKWDVESERLGNGKWGVWVEENKKKGKDRWERGMVEREREWLVGASDGSGEGVGIGIGGGLWEGGEKLMD